MKWPTDKIDTRGTQMEKMFKKKFKPEHKSYSHLSRSCLL